MTRAFPRRPLVPLLISIALTACARHRERGPALEPLSYDYLTPIRLNVASVEVQQRYTPGPADLSPLAPTPPAAAIRQMAQDRLQALGTSGRAVLAVNDSSIVRRGDAYEGSFAVELDIYTSADDRTAFAEARARGRRAITSGESEREALYALTRTLMDQLNVEFEYQIRRNLRSWVLDAPAAPAEPVDEETLPPPPGAAPRTRAPQ